MAGVLLTGADPEGILCTAPVVCGLLVKVAEPEVVVVIEKREAADVVRLEPRPRLLGADDVVDPKTCVGSDGFPNRFELCWARVGCAGAVAAVEMFEVRDVPKQKAGVCTALLAG